MFSEKKLIIGVFSSLLAFLATIVLSTIYSINVENSLETTIVFASGILLVFVSYKGAQHEKYRRYLEIILVLIIIYSLVIAAKSLYQHFVLSIPRPRSLVGNPNYAARYLELAIPIVMSMLYYDGFSTRKKILIGIVTMVLFGGLLVTFTRGAWIAIAIVMLLILLVNKAYKMIGFLSFASVIGFILLEVFMKSSFVVKRINSVFDLHFRSNSERLYAWISSIDIIKDYPLTGTGFANFAAVYPNYKLEVAKVILPHAHNTILVFATESGICSAIFFIVFCLFSAIYIIRGYRIMKSPFYRCLVAGLGFAMLALMINGFVDNAFTRSGVWGIFTLELGMCLGITKKLGFNK